MRENLNTFVYLFIHVYTTFSLKRFFKEIFGLTKNK